jgi:hypothetical protein
MTCGGLKISDRFSVLTLALWLAVCSQGPTLAQTDKAHAAVTVLMPQPRSIDYGDGWLRVNGGFQLEWLGYRNSVLDRAVMRFQNDVASVAPVLHSFESIVGRKIRAILQSMRGSITHWSSKIMSSC